MRIGVFDSGIGGVTVLNQGLEQAPSAQFFYFGDTANVPYGNKSKAQVRQLVISACDRIKPYRLDALVIACNTAICFAQSEFENTLPDTSLVSVVDAGIQTCIRALSENQALPLLIFGTRATIKSHLHATLLRQKNLKLQIFEQECPLLVPLIEEGFIEHPILQATIEIYTKPFLLMPPGIALLACTHYPWIKKAFQIALPKWKFVDPSQAIADILCNRFPEISNPPQNTAPCVEWYFSDPEVVSKTLLTPPPKGWSKF